MATNLTFQSGSLEVQIDEDTGAVTLTGPDRSGAPHGNVIAIEPPVVTIGGSTSTIGRVDSSRSLASGFELVQEVAGTRVTAQLTFPADAVMRYEIVDWNGLQADLVSVAAASDATEHFYGFGEKFNSLDQAGKVVDILTFDNPANKGDRSYKVAPWFISIRGYGFHLDSTARSTFDMRAASGRYVVTNHFGTLKFNVVYGPALTDVLSRYTALTGRPAMPPPFAFGPWISSDIWRDGGEIKYAVTKFRQRGIPVSAFVFDSPWEIAYNDFKFNIPSPTFHAGDPQNTQFGHPGTFEGTAFSGFASVNEMMTFFRDNGLKVICWMTPFVDVVSNDEEIRGQNLGEAKPDKKDASFFVRASENGPPLVVPWWKGRGSPIDFTNPQARDWLSDRLNDLLAASTVDTRTGKEPAIGGFKTDDGESGNGTNTYIPDTAVYSDGRTGKEIVNGYCLEYHKTVYGVLGNDGLLFARSGFSGTQAFPGCWAGDNEPNFGDQNGLPSVIVAGLSAAMSGFSIWGHDVGGYQNTNFSPLSPADLFIRWTQFGCFSPIMQMHRQVDGTNLRQYPWGYAGPGESTDDNQALSNYQFYATLHTRLFPYLAAQAKQSSDTGLPILRPLVLLHPDDPKTITVQHTYYFGGDLLVAPVIEPNANERGVYLPEGDWLDFWTNERHTGKQDITWTNPASPDPPKSKIPVFVRDGAIIPLILDPDVQTLCSADYVNNPAIRAWDGGLEISVYPAGTSSFTLLDGASIQSASGGATTNISIDSPSVRPILLRVLAARPSAVVRDGIPVTEFSSPADFSAATEGWRFDAVSGFVLVKFLHAGGTTGIAV
jgi:alpha-D-xyloside xylohydrolase